MDNSGIKLVVRPRRGKRRRRWIIAAVAVLAAVSASVLLVWWLAAVPFDKDAKEGAVADPGQIAARLQNETDNALFRLKVNAEPYFETGGGEGTLFLENPPDNKLNMKAVLTLDETGETLYESGMLYPGGQELKVKLNKTLAAGEYPATVTATAVDPETEEISGVVQASVTLKIGG